MMSLYKEQLDLRDFADEDDLSDDEVFTQGGKSIPLEENGVNKPLMAPRYRAKDNIQTKVRKVPSFRVIWAPLFYFLVTLCTVISIICLVIFLINTFMKTISRNEHYIHMGEKKKLLPCTKISTQDVWVKSFPMLTTETAIRLNDINSDGIEDIILGFGTGADAFYYPIIVCQVYFPKAREGCGGGILALNGKTGDEIWRHYTAHEIFAINCNVDLNADGVKDCLGGGRMATFSAISGKDGLLLWEFDDQNAKIDTSNVYTPQYIEDVDFDNVPDLIVIHGGDPMKEPGSKTRLIGRILIMSGKSGRVLKWMQVPDKRESYYSPQIFTHPDGTKIVLFGTGGETHGGSLWYIKLNHLLNGQINKARRIYSDNEKGIMTPPVLIDITKDGVVDIVMAMFNSTVIAFDGLTFTHIWSYHQPSSESYSTPAVGYFNDDDIPDFMINYQTGPGFPIYYYTQTTILNGLNGHSLLPETIKMTVGTQSSPLVISLTGKGNDVFIYWVSDCHGAQNKTNLEFGFLKGTSVHDQSRADFCKLRFKEKLFTRMYALTSYSSSPGTIIYDSDLRKATEYSNPINYTALGLEFLYRHPEYQQEFERYLGNENNDMENHIIDEDIAELPLPYDKLQLQKILNNRGYLANNPYSSINDYNNLEDYQNDRTIYSPYYSSREMPENQLYYPLKQYRNVPKRYMRKPVAKNAAIWFNLLPSSSKSSNFNHQYETHHNKRMKKNILQSSHILKNSNKKDFYLRHTRHVGPHDGGGIQRVISTGTLAPSLLKNGSGIDILYATFWFYPSDTQGLLPEDKECIKERMKQEKERFELTSEYHGMDHDAYEEMVTEECLRSSGHFKSEKDINAHKIYNPFNRPMGQMTVYRTHIDCPCLSLNKTSEQKCAKILPFDKQMWTSYMGFYGNSIANPRKSM